MKKIYLHIADGFLTSFFSTKFEGYSYDRNSFHQGKDYDYILQSKNQRFIREYGAKSNYLINIANLKFNIEKDKQNEETLSL